MKKIVFFALAVAAMTSCSKDAANDNSEGGLREIRLGSGIAAQTKAVYDGDVAVSDLQFLRLDAAATSNDFTGAIAFSGSRAVGGNITFRATQRYKAADNTYFASYYPAGLVNSNVVNWTIDGKTDIMTAATVDCGSNDSPASASLAYKHQLAQVEVICKAANDDGGVQTRWGNITGIKMVNTPTSANLAYNGLVVTPSATVGAVALSGDDYTTALAPFAIQASTASAVNAAGMFFPSASQIFELEIATVSGGTKAVTIDLGAGNILAQGKKHKITLTFQPTSSQTEITVGSSIEGWTNGAAGTGSVD